MESWLAFLLGILALPAFTALGLVTLQVARALLKVAAVRFHRRDPRLVDPRAVGWVATRVVMRPKAYLCITFLGWQVHIMAPFAKGEARERDKVADIAGRAVRDALVEAGYEIDWYAD